MLPLAESSSKCKTCAHSTDLFRGNPSNCSPRRHLELNHCHSFLEKADLQGDVGCKRDTIVATRLIKLPVAICDYCIESCSIDGMQRQCSMACSGSAQRPAAYVGTKGFM